MGISHFFFAMCLGLLPVFLLILDVFLFSHPMCLKICTSYIYIFSFVVFVFFLFGYYYRNVFFLPFLRLTRGEPWWWRWSWIIVSLKHTYFWLDGVKKNGIVTVADMAVDPPRLLLSPRRVQLFARPRRLAEEWASLLDVLSAARKTLATGLVTTKWDTPPWRYRWRASSQWTMPKPCQGGESSAFHLIQ